MKEVFRQYGGVLIAAAATSAFLVLMGNIVLAQGGMLAHNTLRGAAGGALESAEMLKALGYITKK